MSLLLPQLAVSEDVVENNKPTQYLHRIWQTLVDLLTTTTIQNNGTLTASSVTTTHKLAIDINGTTYYVLLSNV